MVARAHETAHQFPIRERLWPTELKRTTSTNILFVCGDIHLYTFTNFLAAEKISSTVFGRGISVNPSNDIEYEALQYAQDNDMFGKTDCFCLGS